jgi:flagellar motility protein MotE (MotC chaperone)
VFKLLALTFTLAAAGSHDPTPPTPPAAPTAPKEPEVPKAERKSDKGAEKPADKADKSAEKPAAGKTAESGKTAEPGKTASKGDAHKAEAEDHGADPAEKPGKKSKAARSSGPPPPALTGSALRNELKQNGGDEKGGAPLTERAKLEQMAAEITKAREALKQDTARLEAMLRGGGDGRMPIGDPMMEPVASPGGPAASKEAMKEQILTVSKAMKGMKPEQAAAIISRLDRVLASEILRRMKPADAGAVMASVKPELAAELATAIATRKSMVDGDSKAVKK